MIVFKVLLIIIRIPFTVWYVLTGWFWLVCAAGGAYASKGNSTTFLNVITSLLAFEFASLTKFYNIRDADLNGVAATILKFAFIAGALFAIIAGIYAFVAK